MLRRGSKDTTPTNAALFTGLTTIPRGAIEGLLILDHCARNPINTELFTDDDRRIVTNGGTVPTVSSVAR